MKLARNTRLSLRKLFTAMLAVGPLAVLPAPVWAAVPTTQPFTVSNGSATWTGSGNTGSINTATTNTVLTWGNTTGTTTVPYAGITDGTSFTNFLINAGDTFNFILPPGGSVLNRVSAGSNLSTKTAAQINGNLFSNGRVIIMSTNGDILIGGGAQVSTSNGLILSTQNDTSDFAFIANGNVSSSTGNVTGNITIGNGAVPVSVIGNLAAYGGIVTTNNASVTGDYVVNQSFGSTTLNLTGNGGPTTVGGNLSATNSGGQIAQLGGNLSVINGVTTLTAGNAVTLANAGNDFNTVVLNVSGGDVSLRDVNNITLGSTTASAVSNNLLVNATGNISTGGMVTVNGTAQLNAGANVTFANNSNAGTFSATANIGSITANATSNLTTGALTAGGGGTINLSSTGVVTINGTASTNGGNITVAAQGINSGISGALSATNAAVALSATGGNIVLPGVTASTLILNTTGGSVSQFGTSVVTLSGISQLVANTGTGNVNLTNNNVLTNTTVNATAGSVTLFGVGNSTTNTHITLGDINVTGNLTINTALSTAVASGNVLIGTGFGTVSSNFNIGGALNISTNASQVTDNPYVTEIVFGAITVNTVAGNSAVPAAAAGAQVVINAASTNPDGLSLGRFGQWNVNAGTSTVNIAEGQTMNLGAITGNAITFRTVSGTGSDILVNGQITNTGTGTVTFNTNSGGSVIQSGSGNLAIFSNTSNNTTGAVTVNLSTAGRLDLPNPSNAFSNGQVLLQNGSSLNIVSGTSIKVNLGNVTGGNTSISTVGTTSNTISFANAGTTNASNVTLNSSGDVILGGSTLSIARLTVIAAGNITQAGGFAQMNNTLTLTAGGNIALSNVTNNLTGNVILSNVVGDSTVYSARNLTISGTSAGNVTAVAGTAVAGTGTNTFSGPWNLFLGNLNVKGLNAGASNGNTTIGGIGLTATVSNNGTGYTATGNQALVFSGGGGGTGAAGTATITGGVITAINITSIGSGYTSAPTVALSNATGGTGAAISVSLPSVNGNAAGSNATSGVGGNITQLANASLHVENTADFVTQNATINLANNGNSFGRVQASTGAFSGGAGSGVITITEDSSLKVGNIATTGITTLTSRFGSIIDDPNANDIIGMGGAFVLNAPTGSVNLNSTHTTGTTIGNITGANITAPAGSASIFSNNTITLGAVNVNSLSVVAGNAIIQTSDAALKVFGPANFTATDNITLTNSANNFGPVTLVTTGVAKNLSVTENGTLNIRKVTMPGGGNGTFTAQSINGDIIDTGLGGVVAGGSISGNLITPGQGVVSLTATNGNIVIDDPTSDFPTTGGVLFNAKNVTLSVLGFGGYTLAVGSQSGTSVAGNLTVSSALGDINGAGNITVSGDASFQTGTRNISLQQAGNSFGTIRFVGNQVTVTQTGDMKIVTGSQAIGQAFLTTNSGNISIVNRGGQVSFGNNVSLTASGNITLPKLVTAVGNLTVSAAGTKDLSALSITGDLNGKTPGNGGTGAYIAPQP